MMRIIWRTKILKAESSRLWNAKLRKIATKNLKIACVRMFDVTNIHMQWRTQRGGGGQGDRGGWVSTPNPFVARTLMGAAP